MGKHHHGNQSPNTSTLKEEETITLFNLLHGYVAIGVASIVILTLALKGARHRRKSFPAKRYARDGLFVMASWPARIRHVVSLGIFSFVFLPLMILGISWLTGVVLALCEGWALRQGFEYTISNIATLPVPLTQVTPKTGFGIAVDILVSLYTLIFSVTAMGLIACLAFVTSFAEAMPPTFLSLLRYFLFWIPVVVLSVCFLSGAVLAWLEHWPVFDGFLYIISSILGDDTPLTTRVIATGKGKFFEIVCMCVGVGTGGAVIGMIGAHPWVVTNVALVEGSAMTDVQSRNGFCRWLADFAGLPHTEAEELAEEVGDSSDSDSAELSDDSNSAILPTPREGSA